MGNLLSLALLTALAQETFATNKAIDKVFATADGNIFLPDAHNLARNHARQERLEVYEISRTGATTDDIIDHIETDAKANELKREEKVADAAAQAATLPSVPATGVAVPIEAAAAAQAVGITAAVEQGSKSIDKPAAEGAASTEAPNAKATSSKPAAKKAAATRAEKKPASKAKAPKADAPKAEAPKAEAPKADTAGAANE